jgi:hypothetical protein
MTDEAEPILTTAEENAADPDDLQLPDNPCVFTFWERVKIFLASRIGYFVVLLVGHSLRWEVQGWENWEAARKIGKGLIYTFWHREIFAATWFWRKRGIVVMTSRNFDGEYIARIIQRHGYGAARGSSSRGAGRALVEMIRCLRRGVDTAFTIDGPRGPRFVAKRGAVLLAKPTGAAILCFHIALRRAYVFRKSWDQTEIPYPFSRAAIFIAPPILVSRDADEAEQARKLAEVQATLDGLRGRGGLWLAGQSRNSKTEARNS